MRSLIIMSLLGVLVMFSGCRSKDMSFYDNSTPEVDIKEFFNGEIQAWGLVQDWRGRVITRFDVDMVGSWKGDKGQLEEEFRYYDGKKQFRLWEIEKISDNTYKGSADDIIGMAQGVQNGSAVNWHYTMDIPVDGKIFRIKLDDWMWQMNDGVLINRSYMKKFGITVAELTLFMKKKESK